MGSLPMHAGKIDSLRVYLRAFASSRPYFFSLEGPAITCWRASTVCRGNSRPRRRCATFAAIFLSLLWAAHLALAITGWFDDSFRRPISVTWDAEHAEGGELCLVSFYTHGHHNLDGSDIRVSTDEGRQVAAKVMRIGPGDRVSVLFSLVKETRNYFVYFGNPTPPANRAGMDDVKIQYGLLLDTHEWNGAPVNNAEQIEEAWAKAGPLIGRTMIDTPFLGFNPFSDQERTISRLTGSLFVPLEGEYDFSVFADDRGALYIDGAKLLFATQGPANITFNKKIRLTRGRHEFLFYHVNMAAESRFTVAWLRPDARGWEVIPRASFGVFARGNTGPLEEIRKPIVADFTIKYGGESYYADNYSHRYRFAAVEPKTAGEVSYQWDFGDGQTSTLPEIQHVYLTDGVYPVQLSVQVGQSKDVQVSKLQVSRDWAHIDGPATDDLIVQSKIVENYKVDHMPEAWLPRATWLHQRAGQLRPMLQPAVRLAGMASHPNVGQAFGALADASRFAVSMDDPASAVKIWDALPPGSDLQPNAAAAFGRLLLWRTADFPKALTVLQPYANGKDRTFQRLYADALILNQKADDGRKILESLTVAEPIAKRAALSGALARTIEYYIVEKDAETGEAQWDHWQNQFPADFLEGYSVMLKVKLMELKGVPQSAAALAEAFAKAVPGSSYSPQLLYRASKLLEKSDAARSQELSKLLRDRYPEDPLAQ